MTESDAIKYLKESFHIQSNSKGLILLHSIKNMLSKVDDEGKKRIGMIIVEIATTHGLADQQLLKFFNTTTEAVVKSVGAEFLQEHGLYRSLVTSPQLSSMCELFFDAWLAASYEENPFKCAIRRVGNDAFRIVAILPDGKEVEYPEDMTAAQVFNVTNCPNNELRTMPVLQ